MFEQDVSDGSFEAFARDGVLNTLTIQVIVDKSVQTVDSDGDVRRHSYLVTMSKSDAIFEKLDTLIFESKTYELQDIVEDDGILVSISAT